jgi:hypothetical protein
MSKLDIVYFVALSFVLGVGVGAFIQSRSDIQRDKFIIKHDSQVQANVAYVMGCQMAFHVTRHDRDDDPLDAAYIEFCVHSAVAYANETEHKQTK